MFSTPGLHVPMRPGPLGQMLSLLKRLDEPFEAATLYYQRHNSLDSALICKKKNPVPASKKPRKPQLFPFEKLKQLAMDSEKQCRICQFLLEGLDERPKMTLVPSGRNSRKGGGRRGGVQITNFPVQRLTPPHDNCSLARTFWWIFSYLAIGYSGSFHFFNAYLTWSRRICLSYVIKKNMLILRDQGEYAYLTWSRTNTKRSTIIRVHLDNNLVTLTEDDYFSLGCAKHERLLSHLDKLVVGIVVRVDLNAKRYARYHIHRVGSTDSKIGILEVWYHRSIKLHIRRFPFR